MRRYREVTMFASLRNDIRMLLRGLAGHSPPYLIERSERRQYRQSVRATRLKLIDVERRGLDVTVWLDNPAAKPFLPGQFLTISSDVAGLRLKRAYSISSSPDAPERLRLTIRRVPNGVMSNHLNDHLAPGDMLDVLGPSGRFTWRPDTSRPFLAVAGGSGLTPIMAMIYAALAHSETPIHLVYANRDASSGLYLDELTELERQHERLTIQHVVGELTDQHLAACPFEPDNVDVYLCGPTGLMDMARRYVAARGVPTDRIATETFHSPSASGMRDPRSDKPHAMTVRDGDVDWTGRIKPGETLLEAGLRAGAKLPFSCAMGGCGACRLRLSRGAVAMDEPHCLSAREQEEGYILTCVAYALEPCVIRLNPDALEVA